MNIGLPQEIERHNLNYCLSITINDGYCGDLCHCYCHSKDKSTLKEIALNKINQ